MQGAQKIIHNRYQKEKYLQSLSEYYVQMPPKILEEK